MRMPPARTAGAMVSNQVGWLCSSRWIRRAGLAETPTYLMIMADLINAVKSSLLSIQAESYCFLHLQTGHHTPHMFIKVLRRRSIRQDRPWHGMKLPSKPHGPSHQQLVWTFSSRCMSEESISSQKVQ